MMNQVEAFLVTVPALSSDHDSSKHDEEPEEQLTLLNRPDFSSVTADNYRLPSKRRRLKLIKSY